MDPTEPVLEFWAVAIKNPGITAVIPGYLSLLSYLLYLFVRVRANGAAQKERREGVKKFFGFFVREKNQKILALSSGL